jgi:hypothetical protein
MKKKIKRRDLTKGESCSKKDHLTRRNKKKGRKQLRRTRTNIGDLPPEMLLEIFSWLGAIDVHQGVALVCKKWCLLARHPLFLKDLSFNGRAITTYKICELLRCASLLRRLSLCGRCDTDAILQQVCKSNRLIEVIEIERCRGSAKTAQLNGDILKKILQVCPRLSCLSILGPLVSSCDFYRVLARTDDRMESFSISNATTEGILCYLETRAQFHRKQSAMLNKELRPVDEIKDMLSQSPDNSAWSVDIHY